MLPFVQIAGGVALITVASYWLTGRRSLVSSTLIALYGPIEVTCAAF